jgi:hypothetical protein
MKCPSCDSNRTIKKGKEYQSGIIKQRYKCKACTVNFHIPLYSIDSTNNVINNVNNNVNKNKNKNDNRTWVITTALNNSETNVEFLESLLTYCNVNSAELMIIPLVYNPDSEDLIWDTRLEQYFTTNTIKLRHDLKLAAAHATRPTSANPLSSCNSNSKGISTIVPATQIMMKTIAVNHVAKPVIAHTTGCISHPTYKQNAVGDKALFNHSFAALVVEEDISIDSFHIRILNCDETGAFYDLDSYYKGSSHTRHSGIPAIVLGDEHVVHLDPSVKECTFGKGGICDTLKPQYLIRHDVLDFHSASHHHDNNFFLRYEKFKNNTNDVSDELKLTAEYLISTTPVGSTSLIVDSNHNQHLDKWLDCTNFKSDPQNAKIYLELALMKINAVDSGRNKCAFRLWFEKYYNINFIKFIDDDESFKLFDIELAMHGSQGLNGSRGSTAQFAKLGSKSIIGHQHSPNIVEGAYCVGHSSVSKMGYNKGPSSWHQAHCIIQPNGKRQMIFLSNGKWRR